MRLRDRAAADGLSSADLLSRRPLLIEGCHRVADELLDLCDVGLGDLVFRVYRQNPYESVGTHIGILVSPTGLNAPAEVSIHARRGEELVVRYDIARWLIFNNYVKQIGFTEADQFYLGKREGRPRVRRRWKLARYNIERRRIVGKTTRIRNRAASGVLNYTATVRVFSEILGELHSGGWLGADMGT